MYPLEGIKVIDLSWGWAGPICTSLLASMGAQVIKVESHIRMDFVRQIFDPVTRKIPEPNQCLNFNVPNLNKFGVTISLRHPKGVNLVKELVGISDVVVESFTPGRIAALGLGYEQLSAINPGIVMLSFSASGQTGPEADTIGYAPVFACLGGLSEMTGYPDGPPSEIRANADTICSFTAVFGVLAALHNKKLTGEGQYIDCSGQEVMSCLIADSLLDFVMNGTVQTRCGNQDDIFAPCNCYPCKGEDKWVSIVVSKDDEWEALCMAMGNPAWANHEKFSDQLSRWRNQGELDAKLGTWTMGYTATEIMNMLQKVGVAAVPSFSFDDLACDAHLDERDITEIVKHPEVGEYFVSKIPWRFSATPSVTPRRGAPLLGEHTDHVLKEILHKSDDEVKTLRDEGVLT